MTNSSTQTTIQESCPVVHANSIDERLDNQMIQWINDSVAEVNGMITSHPLGCVTVEIDFVWESPPENDYIAVCRPKTKNEETPDEDWPLIHFWLSAEVAFNFNHYAHKYEDADCKDTIVHEILHAVFFTDGVFKDANMYVENDLSAYDDHDLGGFFEGAYAQEEYNGLFSNHPQFHNLGVPLAIGGSHLNTKDSLRSHCCMPGFPDHGTPADGADGDAMYPNDTVGRQLVNKLTLAMAKDLGFGVDYDASGVRQDYSIYTHEELADIPNAWTSCEEMSESDHCNAIILWDFIREYNANTRKREVRFSIEIKSELHPINDSDHSDLPSKWYYHVSDSNYPAADDSFTASTAIPEDAVENLVDTSTRLNGTETSYETPTLGYYLLRIWLTTEGGEILAVTKKRYAILTEEEFCVSGATAPEGWGEDPNGVYGTTSPTPAFKENWPGDIDIQGRVGRQLWQLTYEGPPTSDMLSWSPTYVWPYRWEASSLATKWVIEISDDPREKMRALDNEGVVAISEETEGEPWEATWPEDIIVTVDECEPTPTPISISSTPPPSGGGDPHVTTFFGEKYDM
jgi:hypothetical protein